MDDSSMMSSPLLASSPPSSSSGPGSSPPNYNATTHTKSLDYQYDGPPAYDDNDNDEDGARSNVEESIDEFASSKTTASQTFLHLLKGYVGPGCLSLPWAVSQMGLVKGTIGIAAMSYWSSYNCWTVVKIKRYIERSNNELRQQQQQQQQQHNTETADTKSERSVTSSSVASSSSSSALTYPDVGEWAYGDKFEQFVSACICVQQLAVCTVFFSFIGENIYAVCQLVPDAVLPRIFMSHIGVMSVALPFVAGLSFIPNLRVLTPVIALATVLLFSGFGVLGYIIFAGWEERPTDPIEIRWKEAPLALCAILYSYEGICLILPIESAMAEPKKFKKVFWGAMTCCAIIFAIVANLCVLAFGEVTNGSVTAFLLEEYKDNASLVVFIMIANTAVSLSVLFTYPLQLFPTFELLGPKVAVSWWKFRHGGKRGRLDDNENDENDLTGFDPMPTLPEHDVASLDDEDIYENFEQVDYQTKVDGLSFSDSDVGSAEEARKDTRSSTMSDVTDVIPTTTIPGDTLYLRAGLVFMTYLVAAIVPNVQALISLSGALAGSSTALLIPPVLELALIDHLESNPDIMASPRLRPPSQQQNHSSSSSFWRFCQCDVSGKFWKKKLKCFSLFWMGFIFMLIGAYASVSDIVSIWVNTGK